MGEKIKPQKQCENCGLAMPDKGRFESDILKAGSSIDRKTKYSWTDRTVCY